MHKLLNSNNILCANNMFIAKKYRMVIICLIFVACLVGILYYFTYNVNTTPLIQEGIANQNNFPATVTSTTGNVTYTNVGCWVNGSTTSGDQAIKNVAPNSVNTLQKCIDHATANGYDTAGWQQDGNKCYVGNNNQSTWNADSNYTKYGRPDSSVGCTGPNINVVYTLNPVTPPVSYGTAPNPYYGYDYKGCYSLNPDSTVQNMTKVTQLGTTGPTLMANCIDYAKSSTTTPYNTAIISGSDCYVGNMGIGNQILSYFGLTNLPSATTTNYCGVTGTSRPSDDRSTYMVYSSYEGVPPATVNSYSYRGCYKKTPTGSTGSNALPYKLSGGPFSSIESCIAAANGANYKTAALSNVNECWVGNQNIPYLKDNYSIYGKVDSAEQCDINYAGQDSLLVYSTLNDPVTTTINGYKYGGCWNDPNGNNLPTKLYKPASATEPQNVETMSLEECIQAGNLAKLNSVAYKKDGKCFGGNQGSSGVNYKKNGEIKNNNVKCDVRNPGDYTSVIYTTHDTNPAPENQGLTYKGCWKNGSPPFGEETVGAYTLDECIALAKNSNRGFDTAYYYSQNQCILGTSSYENYKKYGSAGSDCNSYYPSINNGLVYSTSSQQPDYPNIEDFEEAVGDYEHPERISATNPANTYLFKGYWNESLDRAVPNLVSSTSSGINDCVNKANKMGYSVVSFQKGSECWGGAPGTNYKKYGVASSESLNNGSIIAEIYSYGPEPTPHPNCGINTDGFSTMDDPNTANANIPQPSYSTPQTTTVVFDPLPNTYTTITYSQTPNPSLAQSSTPQDTPSAEQSTNSLDNTQTGSSSSTTSTEPSSSASESVPSSAPAPYSSSSTNNVPTSTPESTSLSTSTQTRTMSGTSIQQERNPSLSQWLPNTPFVYENNMNSSPPNSSQPTPSPTPPQTSSQTNNPAPVTDIINNQYGNPSYGGGIEQFSLFNSIGSYFKEGVESLSPPQNEIPGLFVPKTQIVPPVCPSVKPILVKPQCPATATAPVPDNSRSSQNIGENSMTLNNGVYVNQNSKNEAPSPQCKSGSTYGGNYDNIPQPYLPSFSGFGM